MTEHTGTPKDCPGCAELREMIRHALTWEVKAALRRDMIWEHEEGIAKATEAKDAHN